MKQSKTNNAEELIGLLYSGRLSYERAGQVREWLTDPQDAQIKDKAHRKLFDRMFGPQYDRELVDEMWPQIAIRLGMDPGLGKRVRKPLKNKTIFRIAMAIVPLMLLGGISVWYFGRTDRQTSGDTHIITESVPVRDTRRITLPDGSEARISDGTVITYAGNFTEDRRVRLDGEAFFSVTADPEHPFTVDGEGVHVTVLGTEFFVKTYSGRNTAEIKVASGKVAVRAEDVEETTVVHGQHLIYDKEEKAVELRQVGKGEMLRLCGAGLSFSQTTLEEVLRTTEEYFGVTVIVTGTDIDMGERVTVNFHPDATIEEVLKVLSIAFHDFEYTIDGDTVAISGMK